MANAPFDNKFRFRLIGKIIRRSGFGKVTLIFIALFLACAAIVSICDPQAGGFGNAIWYCFQVVTTIGFGDVSVTSPISRAACMALSIMSIFFIAIVTGVVVSYCSESIRERVQVSKGQPIKIKQFSQRMSVCKLSDLDEVNLNNEFTFAGHTDDEFSLVCPTENAPDNAIERNDGWRMMRIQGVLDFSLVGVLSKISTILADNSIAIFAISTFNTDYILVKEADYARSLKILAQSGYTISYPRS